MWELVEKSAEASYGECSPQVLSLAGVAVDGDAPLVAALTLPEIVVFVTPHARQPVRRHNSGDDGFLHMLIAMSSFIFLYSPEPVCLGLKDEGYGMSAAALALS